MYTLNLQLHGIPASLISNSALLAQRLQHELHHFNLHEVTPGNDQITIHFRVIPFFHWKYRWHLNKKYIHGTEEIISYTDISKRTIYFWAERRFKVDEAVVLLTSSLGYLARLVLSQNYTLAVFHAAAVALQGKGMLLLGDSGAGKTSLAYLCSADRFEYFSDEDSFIVRDPATDRWIIFGFQRHFRIADPVFQIIGDKQTLQQNVTYADGFGEGVLVISPAAHLPVDDANRVELQAIFILNNQSYIPQVTIEQLPPGQCFSRLLSYWEAAVATSEKEIDQKWIVRYNRQSFQVIEQLADRFSIYQLNYNFQKHWAEIPEMLRKFVDETKEPNSSYSATHLVAHR